MQSQKELTAMYLWRIFKEIIPKMLIDYHNKVNPSRRKEIENISDDRNIIKFVINETSIKGENKNILCKLLNYSNKFAHNMEFDHDYIAGLLNTMITLFLSEMGGSFEDATSSNNAKLWKLFVEAQQELVRLNGLSKRRYVTH